ncbi:hypothetical protein HYALB_00013001 [Hymenoscyphus albidus]|uniref:F-box domain-containing protein n=1 Tax=Hymenoscyphus albidus TaxID=595503 RepID=A0A9N9LQK0_9HELO|nr:hypothetical protein HYALB_00013001 [Hymenoscyphus albidus]
MSQIPSLPPATHESPTLTNSLKEPVNLATLPAEVLRMVYSHLNPAHACLLSLTCPRLRSISKLQPAIARKETARLERRFHQNRAQVLGLSNENSSILHCPRYQTTSILHCVRCQRIISNEGDWIEALHSIWA